MTFIITNDRLTSIYFLNNINLNYASNIKKVQSDMNYLFADKENIFQQIVDEQVSFQNIEISNEKIYLTKKGKRILKLFKIVNRYANIQNKY